MNVMEKSRRTTKNFQRARSAKTESPRRPKGKKTRYFIDNEFIDNRYLTELPKCAPSVYSVIARHAYANDQVGYISISTIAKEAGVNRNYAEWGVRILESLRLIEIIRQKNEVNLYIMLDSNVWRPPKSINFDTLKSISKKSKSVYQKEQELGIRPDTRNHILKSNNEISVIESDGLKEPARISEWLVTSVIKKYGEKYSHDMCVKAIEEAKKDDVPPFKFTSDGVLEKYLEKIKHEIRS